MSESYIGILASGTGGHVYPAYTLSQEFIKKGYKIIWFGTSEGLENKIIKDKSIIIKNISSKPIRGKGTFQKILGIIYIFKSIYQSFIIVRKYRPKFIFGFGGFVSTAPTIAAFFLNITTFLLEQNSVAGTANKINYYFCKKVFETFPLSFSKINSKIIHTGNFVRKKFYDLEKPEKKYLSESTMINILVLGGSQGSQFFNKVLPFAFSHFNNTNLSIKHISGEDNKLETKNRYKKYHLDVSVQSYVDDIENFYDWSDIVICRSGSTSISELSAIGKASILVPFPYATDKHQLKNAQFLADSAAAILIEQSDSFTEEFVNILNLLLNDRKRLYMLAKNIQDIFPQDPLKVVLKELKDLESI
ncbi:MAG: undecaprenyldiphospho-muramoylpentapeptide beta-N-acetylglucosaminyltransferase [Gammaproteobacteria bacterium]|nr:undecaprenyldiphospho-muramoylpentapeptide beta-N-acetylglucosaminyltransferase [Gammaproteobacteria bacterium]|tara:strand:+ start:73 stop:1155 length:1083 start_codon:yes stop_codon:yes gene_type:complete